LVRDVYAVDPGSRIQAPTAFRDEIIDFALRHDAVVGADICHDDFVTLVVQSPDHVVSD
jgi:hypothetical protein